MKYPLIYLLLLVLLGASCAKEDKKVKRYLRDIERTKVFLKGDPQTLVKDAELNKTSFIHVNQLDKFSNYYLSTAKEYTQVGDKGPEDFIDWAYSEVKKGQEPPTADLTQNFAAEKYHFVPVNFYGNDGQYYEYRRQNGKRTIPAVFVQKGEVLSFAGIAVANQQIFAMEALHYSMKEDESAFSILARGNDPKYGNVLVAFYFVKDFEQTDTISYGDPNFNYLFGPGVKIGWDNSQNLVINLCGFSRTKLAENAITLWDDALEDSLNIETIVLDSFPPFSDLNVNCVYTIDNYRTILSNTSCNPASASTVPNFSNGELVDADIFFWERELEKYVYNWSQIMIDRFLAKVFLHEMGHVLGLHHQFDGTQSIMSYESNNDPVLYVYDQEAIRELYNL